MRAVYGIRGFCRVTVAAAVLLLSSAHFAQAQSLRQGVAAFNRQDYVRRRGYFIPLAERGVAVGAILSRFHVRNRTRRAAELYRSRDVVPPRRGAGRQPRAIFARPALRQGFWRAAGYRRSRQMAQSVGRGGSRPRPRSPRAHSRRRHHQDDARRDRAGAAAGAGMGADPRNVERSAHPTASRPASRSRSPAPGTARRAGTRSPSAAGFADKPFTT